MFSPALRHRFWIVLFLLFALSTVIPAAMAAPPADAPSPASVFAQMQHLATGPLAVHWDETTGVPRFLRGAIPFVPPETKQSATARALSFFEQYRDLYLMHNPAAELAEIAVQTDKFGMTHVRLQQVVHGVPVWGAQMMVHFTSEGHIRAVNGTYLPGTTADTTPAIDFGQAVRLARTNLLVDDRAALNQDQSGLFVYRRHGTTALAWKIQIFADTPLGNWTIFVDAHDGSIIHRLNALDTAKNRQTYDAAHGSSLPGTLVCNESDPSCSAGDAAAKDAHTNAGRTYDYYSTKFGRDSYDNAGATLISSAHYRTNYNNAFWNGTQMVYGDGDGVTFSYLSGAIDVVAHELTHAVTGQTADLIYEDQPGALNESYSDVFGVFAEFYADPAHADWLLGEDVYTPATPGDALRSMSDPTQGTYSANDPRNSGGQPDHMTKYAHYPLVIDHGGVHANSGIPNKAAYLIAHGGTFFGVPVTGIGNAKTEQIYYRTLTHYLTPMSNFWDAREASIQSCKDLIGSFGISPANCNSVQNGFAAVGVGPSSTMTQHLYLPVIQRLSSFGYTPGIYGQVTDAGSPAAGVQLDLRRCVYGSSCSTQATTTTDGHGTYRFTGVPTPSNAYYYVRYLNPSTQAMGETSSTLPAGADIQETPSQATLGDVGQFRAPPPQSLAGTTMGNRVWAWYADSINGYTAGTDQPGGNFDIADIRLVSPSNSASRSFPVTFDWNRRAAAFPDLYQFEMYGSGGSPRGTGSISDYLSSQYTLTSLPSGFNTGVQYFWDVLAYGPDGYGFSHYSRRITFTAMANGEIMMVAQGRVPTAQVRDLESLRPRER